MGGFTRDLGGGLRVGGGILGNTHPTFQATFKALKDQGKLTEDQTKGAIRAGWLPADSATALGAPMPIEQSPVNLTSGQSPVNPTPGPAQPEGKLDLTDPAKLAQSLQTRRRKGKSTDLLGVSSGPTNIFGL